MSDIPMGRASAHLPASPIEGLLITLFANLRIVLAIGGGVAVLAVVAALIAPVRFTISSQVLVGLGPEFTFRPPAGEAASVSQPIDRVQTMHTEATILTSADLHRATLRAVGVERLYPDAVKVGVLGWIGALLHPAAPKPDPVDVALPEFEAALTVDVPKDGSVITITLRHKDARLGAVALNTLMAEYIKLRGELYADDQSGLVAQQVAVTKATLDEAEAKLAAFKLAHQVSGFEAQRDILLKRRGELQSDRNDAQSQIAQLRARLVGLTKQLTSVPAMVTSGRDTDFASRASAARVSLDALRAQYANAMTQYRPDAPYVVSLRAQIAARELDVAAENRDGGATSVRTTQNPAYLNLQDDKLKSDTGLAVAQTREAQDGQHLAELDQQIAALDGSEQELGQLQLQRTVAEDGYRSASKILDERRVVDSVEARRRPSVQVLQQAVAPLNPPPTRKLILLGGLILAVFATFAAVLFLHAFARIYWQPQALEQDLGIAVIGVIADSGPPPRMLLSFGGAAR